MVSDIVNSYIIQDYENQVQQEKERADKLQEDLKSSKQLLKIKVKNNKILKDEKNTLINENQLISGQKDELQIKNDQLQADMKKLLRNSETLIKQGRKAYNILDDVKSESKRITARLEKVLPDSVPKAENKSKQEYFILIKNPNDEDYNYKVSCAQLSNKTRINKFVKDNPGSSIVLEIKQQPNSQNLYTRIKEQLGHEINHEGKKLRIDPDSEMTEQELIENIKKINDDKYKIHQDLDDGEFFL
jgi:hypothetical protein